MAGVMLLTFYEVNVIGSCYILHMLFDSIDQTVTQDVKGLQRNHKHVLFPAMQFPPSSYSAVQSETS